MRYFAVIAALVALVSAATLDVIVGANGTLAYNPSAVSASVGDIVRFTFVQKNHTATQTSFTTPCIPLAGGVDSGFQGPGNNTNVTSFTQWSLTVNVSTPLWFACMQTGHCQKGMVFAINPTPQKSFAAYQQAATGNVTASATGSGSGAASLSINSMAMLGIIGIVMGLIL